MDLDQDWRRQPKDGASRNLNRKSQPPRAHRVFNQPEALTLSWYPVAPASAWRTGQARSWTLGAQRVVIFRGESGRLYAMDAFCPHFGADLGNGEVEGERLRCYFHRWEFEGRDGELAATPATPGTRCPRLQTYPVLERFGFVWLWPGPGPASEPLAWQGLEGFSLLESKLFVHHHALMMSAIDLHHFFSVHQLPIDFDFLVEDRGPAEDRWTVSGEIPRQSWRTRLFRALVGPAFTYEASFFGGSLVQIHYGRGGRWFGHPRAPRLPEIRLLWAAVPDGGVSRARVFVLHPRTSGLVGRLGYAALSVLVLWLLKDDDVKAYPHMRFDPRIFTEKDRASFEFIRRTERLEVSSWSSAD